MKINNYNDLEYAAKKKLAVYCPASDKPRKYGIGFLSKPKPAAFVMHQCINIINRAIKQGLYIYVKDNDRPVFFTKTCGALMCDREVEGLTTELPDEKWATRFYYGSKYFVGESMSIATMKTICKAFDGIWREEQNIEDIPF